jgi:hypothetical protein
VLIAKALEQSTCEQRAAWVKLCRGRKWVSDSMTDADFIRWATVEVPAYFRRLKQGWVCV